MPRQLATRVPDREYEKIEQLVKAGLYLNVSDFVRDAVRARLAGLALGTSQMDPDRLEEEVEAYLRRRGGEAWPDEMAEDLDVPVLQVLRALESLRRKGRVEEIQAVEREA